MRLTERVTVTGADDSVDPKDLVEIAKEFPFVEFGILVSLNNFGTPRFPSLQWLRRLAAATEGQRVKLAGHVCGSWVRQIYAGFWPCDFLPEEFTNQVRRWQLNAGRAEYEPDTREMLKTIESLTKFDIEVIFQYSGLLPEIARLCMQHRLNVSALFDASGGRGISPSAWSKVFWMRGGFAGGLGPDNVAEEIPKMLEVTGAPFWIDAETKLRSGDNKQFDLGKVVNFLEAARPWVRPEEPPIQLKERFQ